MADKKRDAARMHRDVVTKAPPAGTKESTNAHDAGETERLRRALAEVDKAETN